MAAVRAECELGRRGRGRFWKLLESAGATEVTPEAGGRGVIKISAQPSAEGLRGR